MIFDFSFMQETFLRDVCYRDIMNPNNDREGFSFYWEDYTVGEGNEEYYD